MNPFKLQIVTPSGVFFDDMSVGVVLRTTTGDKGILARHELYAAALVIGKIKINFPDKTSRVAAISGGVVNVEKDKTVILTQSCEWSDEIDLERAELAKTQTEEKLKSFTENSSSDQRELCIAEFKLKRALNRIDVAGG
ncbi:MAG: ATP synthase F1 subunit epsilon [Oscillospiraceae bacterium]|nr:ATP synthase F1 subunit epsilon [Oscillospiraceae bacterium]